MINTQGQHGKEGTAMTDEAKRLAEIRARAEKATAGEWLVNPINAYVDAAQTDCTPLAVCAMLWPTDLRTEDETFANAEFIAHARSDIPFLLAVIERLAKQRDAARERYNELAGNVGHEIEGWEP